MYDQSIVVNGIKFCRIPAGAFLMGRLPADREYVHLNDPIKVEITRDYWMSAYPIRNGEYTTYLQKNKIPVSESPIEVWDGCWKDGGTFGYYLGRGSDYPVVGVNFKEAREFSQWMSNSSKFLVRLPTEAEFEYAAKGRCSCELACNTAALIQGYLRPYGGDCDPYPPITGRFQSNAFGLYDMNGLIWQWCSDYFGELDAEQIVDPKGPEVEPKFSPWKGQRWRSGRSIRGGSFAYGVLHSRCGVRHYSKEQDRNFNLGFRMVLEKP